MKENDTTSGEVIAPQGASPVEKDVTELSHRKVRGMTRDAQLRGGNMSALPATLTGFGILAFFAAGIAFWMIYVPLNAAVSAPAEVVFKSKRQTVQHLEGGIVEKILVRDGDMVQAGQALIVLDNKQVKPIVRMLQEQNMAEKAQIARLEAESGNFNVLDGNLKGNGNKYTQTENRLFKARQEAHQSQIELLRTQILEIRESIKGSQERLALKSHEISLLKEQLDANQELFKEGYVTRTVILDLQRLLAEKNSERESISTAIAGDKQRIVELEQRILAIKADRVQGVVNELKQSVLRRLDQEERIRPMRDTLERQVIRAPVTGKVVGLKISTVGGTIMPREPLMEIAPAGESLILEAKIDMKDVSNIKVGQGAEVSIAGFDARKTLPLRAKVTYISDDRIAPTSAAQGQQPYYSAYLEFEPESIKNLGEQKLIPGMSANVSIAIAPRTALDYMIAPMRESARKALQIK